MSRHGASCPPFQPPCNQMPAPESYCDIIAANGPALRVNAGASRSLRR